jgi:hypothetical protein
VVHDDNEVRQDLLSRARLYLVQVRAQNFQTDSEAYRLLQHLVCEHRGLVSQLGLSDLDIARLELGPRGI